MEDLSNLIANIESEQTEYIVRLESIIGLRFLLSDGDKEVLDVVLKA